MERPIALYHARNTHRRLLGRRLHCQTAGIVLLFMSEDSLATRRYSVATGCFYGKYPSWLPAAPSSLDQPCFAQSVLVVVGAALHSPLCSESSCITSKQTSASASVLNVRIPAAYATIQVAQAVSRYLALLQCASNVLSGLIQQPDTCDALPGEEHAEHSGNDDLLAVKGLRGIFARTQEAAFITTTYFKSLKTKTDLWRGHQHTQLAPLTDLALKASNQLHISREDVEKSFILLSGKFCLSDVSHGAWLSGMSQCSGHFSCNKSVFLCQGYSRQHIQCNRQCLTHGHSQALRCFKFCHFDTSKALSFWTDIEKAASLCCWEGMPHPIKAI